jgi:hypothetical protein
MLSKKLRERKYLKKPDFIGAQLTVAECKAKFLEEKDGHL